MGELTQTPRIPGTRPGAPPEPVQPKATAPYEPRPFVEPPERIPTPQRPPPGPPEPVKPTLALAERGEISKGVRHILTTAGITSAILGGPAAATAIALAPVTADIVQYLLLRQDGQKMLRALMSADGTISRTKLLALAGGRGALEQAWQEERSATPQEAQQAVGTLRQRYAP